jgi:hypothetical protein
MASMINIYGRHDQSNYIWYYGPYVCWPIRVLYFVPVTVARVCCILQSSMVPEP